MHNNSNYIDYYGTWGYPEAHYPAHLVERPYRDMYSRDIYETRNKWVTEPIPTYRSSGPSPAARTIIRALNPQMRHSQHNQYNGKKITEHFMPAVGIDAIRKRQYRPQTLM